MVRRHLLHFQQDEDEEWRTFPPPPPPPISTLALSATGGESGALALLYATVATSVFMVPLILLIRLVFLRVRRRMSPAAQESAESAPWQHPGRRAPPVGLHPALVASFPTLLYDAKSMGSEEAEAGCVVCLEEYREGEALRRLPECGHAFHAACIDAWFGQHTTCPICRVAFKPKGPEEASDAPPSEGGEAQAASPPAAVPAAATNPAAPSPGPGQDCDSEAAQGQQADAPEAGAGAGEGHRREEERGADGPPR